MFIKLYAIALPVFFAIDIVWLGLVARNFYRDQIGFLMKDSINWTAAIVFYLLFIGGLVLFVIGPAGEKQVSMPMSTTVTVESLRYSSRIFYRTVSVVR